MFWWPIFCRRAANGGCTANGSTEARLPISWARMRALARSIRSIAVTTGCWRTSKRCSHLTGRWRDLFNASFEVLLYDLTSTYFEADPPFPEGDKRRHGYSRDHRPDCVQVVIALIITPDGLPLAYEVLPGNTSDKTTLKGFLERIEAQYGKAERVWLMDRGVTRLTTAHERYGRVRCRLDPAMAEPHGAQTWPRSPRSTRGPSGPPRISARSSRSRSIPSEANSGGAGGGRRRLSALPDPHPRIS